MCRLAHGGEDNPIYTRWSQKRRPLGKGACGRAHTLVRGYASGERNEVVPEESVSIQGILRVGPLKEGVFLVLPLKLNAWTIDFLSLVPSLFLGQDCMTPLPWKKVSTWYTLVKMLPYATIRNQEKSDKSTVCLMNTPHVSPRIGFTLPYYNFLSLVFRLAPHFLLAPNLLVARTPWSWVPACLKNY